SAPLELAPPPPLPPLPLVAPVRSDQGGRWEDAGPRPLPSAPKRAGGFGPPPKPAGIGIGPVGWLGPPPKPPIDGPDGIVGPAPKGVGVRPPPAGPLSSASGEVNGARGGTGCPGAGISRTSGEPASGPRPDSARGISTAVGSRTSATVPRSGAGRSSTLTPC